MNLAQVPDMLISVAAAIAVTLLLASTWGRQVPTRGSLIALTGGLLILLGGLAVPVLGLAPPTPLWGLDLSVETDQWIVRAGAVALGILAMTIGLTRVQTAAGETMSQQNASHAALTSAADEQSARELLSTVLRSSLSGVLVMRALRDENAHIEDFEIRLVNKAGEQLIGRPASALVENSMSRSLRCTVEEGLLREASAVIETGLPFNGERQLGADGRWYQLCAVRHGDGLACTFADITDQKRSEQQLRHTALHDALTGLPNRALFSERLERAVQMALRVDTYKYAVLFLDFDRFKFVNDSLGHEVGDQLLLSIAERLRANLRAIDGGYRVSGDSGHLPARLGGDEFVVLLDGIRNTCNAEIVAERLLADLTQPHRIAGHEIISTASIGIVTSDGDYERPEDVLRDADTAMYRAKQSGKARHVLFDSSMHATVVDRVALENELREAVSRGAFLLEYQPIVHLQSGRIAGFEALIRWPNAHRGVVQPTEFIPLAEELGIIRPIGAWALREAVGALSAWRERNPAGTAGISMSVNLSKQELVHADLVPAIRQALQESGLPPRCLRLEVTESIVMADLDGLTPVLSELRGLGVGLSLDDFGTGHSSLSALDQFPVDILKIDKSFVQNAREKREFAAIVNAIVDLARNLDLQVVAEGVETEDQLSMLQDLECDFGQGWLFARSLSADEAEAALGERGWRREAA